jgi:predicted nucleotidyltransferase
MDNKIKTILTQNKPIIKNRFFVKNIGLFGSCVRGEQTKNSDIDILVDFLKPISLFDFLELEEYLENKLGSKIDLVTKKALKPNIGKRIIKELVYI